MPEIHNIASSRKYWFSWRPNLEIEDLLKVYNSFGTTLYFYKQHFRKERQAEIGKKSQEKAKQHPVAELYLFENCSLSSSK